MMNDTEPDPATGAISMTDFQDAVLTALPCIRDELKLLLENAPDGTPAIGTIRELVVYLSDRARAVLFLDSHGMPWDAEIVLRSFYETFARIMYFCTSGPEERTRLDGEFRNVLGAMGERRRALKVHTDGAMGQDDTRGAAILEIFRDPNLFAVEPIENKAKRKAVEQAWSFSDIIATVSARDVEGVKGLSELAGILHQYGVGSHLLHADSAALDLMRDRATRNEDELLWLAASHSCRVYEDIVSLECMAAEALRAMLGVEFADRRALYGKVMRCFDLAKPIYELFYATQAELYRRHGRTEFDEVQVGGTPT